MKDNVVAPTLLHHPGRVGRLVQSLHQRSQRAREELATLAESHDEGQLDLQRHLARQLESLQGDGVADRQTILTRWDHAQEQAIASYEQVTLEVRDKLRRVAATSRRNLQAGIETIDQKVRLRIEAVRGQYDSRKDAPAVNAKSELRAIGESLKTLQPTLQWTRDLTVRRLNRLLEVRLAADPMSEFGEVPPESVSDAISLIDRQRNRLEQIASSMNQGFAAKTTDSFYLPGGVAVFIVVWTAVVVTLGVEPLIPWLIGGVIVAGSLGFAIYAALLWPLRRSTRIDHPAAERIHKVAQLAANRGRAIAKRTANRAGAELEKRRRDHLAEAERWQKEQVEQLRETIHRDANARQEKLNDRLSELGEQFKTGHDQLTQTMTEQLRQNDATIQRRLQDGSPQAVTRLLSARQQQALDRHRLISRWHLGCDRAAQWIVRTNRATRRRYPTWNKVLSEAVEPADHADYIPLGTIELADRVEGFRCEAARAFEVNQAASPASSPSLASGLSVAGDSADGQVAGLTPPPPPTMGVLGEAMGAGLSADGNLSIGELVNAGPSASGSVMPHAISRLTAAGSAAGASLVDRPPSQPVRQRRKRLPVTARAIGSVPLVMHRRVHSALLIETPPSRHEEAVGIAHQAMWRLLHAVRPGRVRLTLIDPVGRGQNFTSFMAIADHDPELIHHRVWSAGDQITAQLSRLDAHVQELIQSSLRDRYEYLEDYNAQAGSLAEPHHIVAAVGFPEALSREAHDHLQSLIESGARCGVMVILVIERGRSWPAGLARFQSPRLMHLIYGGPAAGKLARGDSAEPSRSDPATTPERSAWRCVNEGLSQFELRMASPPPSDVCGAIARRVGLGSARAASVVLPLNDLLEASQRWSPSTERDTGSTAEGIMIPLGSRGGGRSTFLQLGCGVRQHVLVAGKTGSGKSTLLHTIILAGAACYRPDQLLFYLLDFRKGVEFQSYARHRLPHARFIGIQAERAFGRSVLRRLDQEMVARGEAFRQAGVESLADYLQSESRPSTDPMPRLLLIIDEFEELFARDDSLSADCTAMLDRLVGQGHAFGIHVVLASQSLSGDPRTPRATLGQIAVRVALRCGQGDAASVLDPDNAAARLLRRPGEAVFNDAGGAVEGNELFQIATAPPAEHRRWIESIRRRDAQAATSLPATVVFDGNRPVPFRRDIIERVLSMATAEDRLIGWVGEPAAIGSPAVVRLTARAGRNVLIVGPVKRRAETIVSMLLTFAAGEQPVELIWFDGSRQQHLDGAEVFGEAEVTLADVLNSGVMPITSVTPSNALSQLGKLCEQLDQSPAPVAASPIRLVLIDRLQRFATLQQSGASNFSMDAQTTTNGSELLQRLLREGPAAGIHTIVSTTSSEVLHRWLPRTSIADLQIRIVGRISEADSSMLIDCPDAGNLTTATVLLHDTADGTTAPVRVVEMPSISDLVAPAACGSPIA